MDSLLFGSPGKHDRVPSTGHHGGPQREHLEQSLVSITGWGLVTENIPGCNFSVFSDLRFPGARFRILNF